MSAQFPWPGNILPETAAGYDQLKNAAALEGIEIGVADYGGFRTEPDTLEILGFRAADYAKYVARGGTATIDAFRPIAGFGHSFHDYGAAFDVRLVSLPAGMSADAAFSRLGAIGEGIGLRWGGEFHNHDVRHFELPVSLGEAANEFNVATGTLPTGLDPSAMLAGDDSGESAIETELEADDSLTGWIVAGAIAFAGVVIYLARRRLSPRVA